MIASHKTFLKLIQPALQDNNIDIDEKSLHEVVELSKKNNLLMLLYVQLRRYNDEGFKNTAIKEHLKKLKPIFLTNASRSVQQEIEEQKIIKLLNDNNIPALIIKGNEIAKEIYQDPNCRTSIDIDFLIKEADLLKSNEILKKSGYNRSDNKSLKFWSNRIHHAVYVGAETKSIFEMHWNFGIPSYFNLSSDDIWAEIKPAEGGQLKLSPEMILIMLIIHYTLHAYRDLKILVDILWAMKRYENLIHWQSFCKTLEKTGLVKATFITMTQMHTLWKDFIEQFQPYLQVIQELKKKGYKPPSFLVSYFRLDVENKKPYNHSKEQFFVRLTLDKWSLILLSFIKTFFPNPKAIKELYNDKRTWALPANYIRFIKERFKKEI